MTDPIEAFIERLLNAMPALRPSFEETYRWCSAEGLADETSYFFLDEHTRRLCTRFAAGDALAIAEIMQMAGVLETEFGVDWDVDQLIDSGFLILLPQSDETELDVASLLGPKLKSKLELRREWRPHPQTQALVERMIAAFPRLEADARDNGYGEKRGVLAYMFLNDVADRLVEYYLSGSPANLADVHAVLGFLEAEFGTQGEAVDNPIAVSFLEGLPYPGQPGADLVRLLGPKLRAELALQRPALP